MSQTHNDTTGTVIGQMFPRDGAPIRPWLKSELGLNLQPAIGTWRLQHTAMTIHRRTWKCPGSDAGALQADDTRLLACHSVQPSLAFLMPGEDNVDLRIGRNRDYDTAGEIQAHQFGIARIPDILGYSFAQQVPF